MFKKIFFGVLGVTFLLGGAHFARAQTDTTPPTVPTGITASLTQSDQVYVSWSPSTDNLGVAGYQLYRNGTLVANTPGETFFTDNAPGGTYAYTVSAYDAAGNVSAPSAMSSFVTVPTDTTPPTAPTDLAVAIASSSASLSWNVSTDNVAVVGYYIYRNGVRISTGNTIMGTTYTDTGLTPGNSYRYSVEAYDAAGNLSENSNSVTVTAIYDITPPAVPSRPSITATLPTELDIAWPPTTDNVAVGGYNIYRDGVQVGTTNASTTTYADTGLSEQTTYSYQVSAYDTSGNTSQLSTPVAGTTLEQDTTPPSAPEYLVATAPSTSEIDLSWPASTDNVGVAGYYIYQNGTQIATTASTTYANTGLATDTAYAYMVQAYDAAGNVSAPATITGTTLATNPVIPLTPPPATPTAPTTVIQRITTQPTAPTPQPTTTSQSTPPVFTTTLYFGMRNSAVQTLQQFLVSEGLLGTNLATGYFGSLTQEAVQKFQCNQSIVCSGSPFTTGWGYVGVRTRAALNAQESGNTSTASVNTNTSAGTSQSNAQLEAELQNLEAELANLRVGTQ